MGLFFSKKKEVIKEERFSRLHKETDPVRSVSHIYTDSEAINLKLKTKTCPICNRKFSYDRFDTHYRICLHNKEKKEERLNINQNITQIQNINDNIYQNSDQKIQNSEAFSENSISDIQSNYNFDTNSNNINFSNGSESNLGNSELVKCKKCGRTFLPSRIEKHESVCKGLDNNHLTPLKKGVNPVNKVNNLKKEVTPKNMKRLSYKQVSTPNRNIVINKSKTEKTYRILSNNNSNNNNNNNNKDKDKDKDKDMKRNVRNERITEKKGTPYKNNKYHVASPNLPSPSSLANLKELIKQSEEESRNVLEGLLVYNSNSESDECLGEIVYNPKTTTLEGLALIIEEQLGFQIDLSNISRNHEKPFSKDLLDKKVNEIFVSSTDYVAVKPLG